MPRLSRWMPRDEDVPMTLVRTIVFGVFLVVLAPVMASFMVLGAPWLIRNKLRRTRLQAERWGEGICTFARAFDRRAVDPWIIRAVHEELQPYFGTRHGPVPLRPADRLYEELGIDGDELDDVAQTIARRTGRPLVDTERNPAGPILTAGDLVHFFTRQPRVQAA